MITHPQGLFKNAPKGAGRYVFLNQADRLEDLASCRKIGQLVHICQPFFVRSVIIGCAGKKPPIIKVLKANSRYLAKPILPHKTAATSTRT